MAAKVEGHDVVNAKTCRDLIWECFQKVGELEFLYVCSAGPIFDIWYHCLRRWQLTKTLGTGSTLSTRTRTSSKVSWTGWCWVNLRMMLHSWPLPQSSPFLQWMTWWWEFTSSITALKPSMAATCPILIHMRHVANWICFIMSSFWMSLITGLLRFSPYGNAACALQEHPVQQLRPLSWTACGEICQQGWQINRRFQHPLCWWIRKGLDLSSHSSHCWPCGF